MHRHRLTTRLILASTTVAGICITGATFAAPGAGAAPAPLTLTQTWAGGAPSPVGCCSTTRPCGVAESSPALFDDGGTPAVEVGDRQGFLYGLDLSNGVARARLGERDR